MSLKKPFVAAASGSSSSRPPGETATGETVTLREPKAARRPVPEALLHDLWRRQHFDPGALTTTSGRPVAVLAPGRPNTDAGPDFREAHVRVGGQVWHGDVEIHPASSGWLDHDHHRDARYNAVALHVTLYADDWTGGLVRQDGSPLPELVLAPHLTDPLRELLHDFRTRGGDEEALFCAPRWAEVPSELRAGWIEEMAEERLDEKKARLVDRYFAAPDVEALLQERLFAGLGYAKNDDAMADLAHRVPPALGRRFAATGRRELEAALLGAAGLLPDPSDLLDADRATADYATDLAERFQRLRREHAGLAAPMERERWQFFRLRPANFPPLRIAQAAALLAPGGLLHQDPLGRLIEAVHAGKPARALRGVFEATAPTDFWKTHFRLEKATKERDPSIGRWRVDTLIVNAVVPVLLLCAEQREDDRLAAAVRALLRDLPGGSDRVTRRFRNLGSRPADALEAQGLHQLYRTRCREARCLECRIGQHLLGD